MISEKLNPKILFDVHRFISSLLSLHSGRKPSTLRAFIFTVVKKLQLKTSQSNAPIPLYMNIIKMVSP